MPDVAYFATRLVPGKNPKEQEWPAEELADYFRLIQIMTGLDKAMAAMILRSGQTIEHTSWRFRSSMTGGPR